MPPRPSHPTRLAALALAALALGVLCAPAGAIARDLSGCTVAVAPAVYTGSPLRPDLDVRLDGATLRHGVDYVASWRRNVNAGAASVTVSGRGAYSGRKTAFFSIGKASMADADVSGVQAEYPRTGKEVRPAPAVSFNGRALVAGRDYELSYHDNVAAGSGRMELRGKRNLVGTKTVPFRIAEAAKPSLADAKVQVGGATYTGKELKPPVKVTLGGKTLALGADYTLSYRDNVEAGTASAVVKGAGSYTGSKTAAFEVAPRSISKAKASAIPDQTHTGKQAKPKPKLTYGGKTLAEGADYTLSYRDNVKAGTASAIVKGKGNFAGEKAVKFRIVHDPGARIAAAAVALAGGWSKDNRAPGPTGSAKRGSWSDAQKAPPNTKTWRSQKWDWRLYKKVYAKVNAIRPGHRIHHACCDCLPVLATLWAGVDDGYLNGKWPTVDWERSYLQDSGKWTRVGGSGKYWHTNGGKGYGDAGVKLQPGDILCSPKGAHKHFMIYVGHEAAAKRWGKSTKVVLVDEGYGSRWTSGKPMSSRSKAKWLVFRRNGKSLDPDSSKYAGIYQKQLEKYLVP